MFNQQNGQDNQQPMQDVNAPGQPAPAADAQTAQAPAPAGDPQMSVPQPAYESIFDDDHTTNDGSLTSDDQQAAPATTEQQPAQAHITPTETPQQAPAADAPAGDDDLISIKKQALEHLSPLVGKLEQSPEEKFHTTMRIIQASDNHSLVKEAYAAAQNIEDDKVRAQALLDIVNEINYFTKETEQESPQDSE